MRQLVVAALKEDPFLGEIVGSRIYAGSAVGVADIPPRPDFPWIAYKEMLSTAYQEVRKTSNTERQVFQIFCYDRKGSYATIDRALVRVRAVVKGFEGVRSPSGALCSGVSWDGFSQDLLDQEYDANMRYATFRLTASQP